MQRHVVRTLAIRFRLCSQDGRRKRRRGGSLWYLCGWQWTAGGRKRRNVLNGLLNGSGRVCPHDDLRLQPRTGTMGMSEDGVPTRNIESPHGGGVRSLQTRRRHWNPLEHMVLTQTDPAGQFAVVGTLSPSDFYPVGPVGLYVTGGPAGPDVYVTDPNSWTHMIQLYLYYDKSADTCNNFVYNCVMQLRGPLQRRKRPCDRCSSTVIVSNWLVNIVILQWCVM